VAAKLYQSIGRDADAALAATFEGLSPTPEFVEIDDPLTLLASLSTVPSY
jgi:hypothetical protein